VTFELPGSVWAETVYVVGEFNDWDRTATPMHQVGDEGTWTVSVDLEAGRDYQYRYLMDGEVWHTDYGADGFVANEFGSDNSVVHAGLPAAGRPDGSQA
jgi:1,4-alpha-glucan branching enzyme